MDAAPYLLPGDARRSGRSPPTSSSRSSSRSRSASRTTSSQPERAQALSVRRRKPPWYSYDAVTTRERVARRALARGPTSCAARAALGAAPRCRRSPPGESGSAPFAARAADGAAGLRRVADERRVVRAALGAARQVRQVAREPEQLELERERERVERGARRARAGLVERVEEARQRGERALVPLLLGEEAEHRLGADQPDAQAVRLLADGAVRPHEVDAGDRLELARALVELERDVRERLEPAAEARLRLADALRDGADRGRARACRGGGCDRPRRAAASGGRPPRSCTYAARVQSRERPPREPFRRLSPL